MRRAAQQEECDCEEQQFASSCLISPHFAAGAVNVGRGAASFLATESTGAVLKPDW